MNEQELQDMFRTLESEVYASERLRAAAAATIRPRRRIAFRWRMAMGVAAAGFAVCALLLTPSEANGAKIKAMLGAMRDVKSMRATTYIYGPQGRKKGIVVTYFNGMRRCQSRIGSAFERTWLLRDGKEWIFDPFRKIVTTEPYVEEERSTPTTALEYAQQFTDLGGDGPRTSRIVDGPVHNGRPTYKIIYDRAGDKYHAEILVDKATNLPICDAIRNDQQSIDDEYTFNFDVDSSLFDPSFGGKYPTFDLVKEAERLHEAWGEPIETVHSNLGTTKVRNIQVSKEGVVFIGSTTAKHYGPTMIPETVTNEAGTQYLKVRDFTPGNTFSQSWAGKFMRVGDGWPVFSVFVPIEPVRPGHQFTVRYADQPDADRPLFAPKPILQSATVELHVDDAFDGELPDYAASVRLDDFHNAVLVMEMDVRARHFEKAGDFARAARWYRATADETAKFSSVHAHVHMEEELKCLQKLGLTDEANALQAKIDKLRAIDPNIHKSLNMPIPF